jgi:anaerobic magnesium-protoporphyrin IX monomethyl ester cyclase
MRIAFLNPPAADVHWFGDKANFEAPLGVAVLAAYLRERGHDPVIVDVAAERLSDDETLARIAAFGPAIVGITASTVVMPNATRLAEAISRDFPDVVVVLGGKHVTAIPEDVHARTHPSFDLSVLGEGEDTLLEIVDVLGRCGSKADFLSAGVRDAIAGIAFSRDGAMVKTTPRPFVLDLDALPFPARDLLPLERYRPVGNRYKRLPAFSMVAIRGCPYPCAFCSEARTTVRFSSPARVVAEIEHLIATYGAREITFWDDTITLNKKWLHELCNLMIEKRLDITWSCFAVIGTMTPDLLANMKAAGCWNVFYGVETPDDDLKRTIRVQKNGSVDNVRKVVRETQAAGIEVRAAFMLGLPGETPERAMRTLDMALELEPDYAQWNYTVPYPRTHVWNELASHGRLLARDWGEFSNWYPAFLPFAYETPDDLIRVRTLVLRKFYLRPRYVWRRLRKIRTAGDVLRYVALLIDFLAVLGRAGGDTAARARASATATRIPSGVAASHARKSVAA